MSFSDTLARWRARLTGDRGPTGPAAAAQPSEQDVGHDTRTVASRASGGEHDRLDEDSGSVTGTGRTGVFVGQVAGDDLGYAEETGAERRATDGAGDTGTGTDTQDERGADDAGRVSGR